MVEYTDEFKAKLDKRYADSKSGKAKMITAAERQKRIRIIINTTRTNSLPTGTLVQ